MNKLVVDTSVFVSLFGTRDAFSENSAAFFSHVNKDTEIIIPSLVVAETLVSLAKQKLFFPDVYDRLIQFTLVSLDAQFLEQFRKLVVGDVSMRSADFIIATTAKLNRATLISWDKRHLSKHNTICETLTPEQFISQVDAN